VVRAYQQTCSAAVQPFDGHIAQYLGDGLLIYFGYPQAHEDDAQRAVRAGLSILDAMQALSAQLVHDKGVRVAIRLGIHTGLVVVGTMGGGDRQEQLALGDTPNIAARLQGLAVWEDLHWADPSTLEFLGLLIDQTPTARMLTLLTCRPEFRPPWSPRSYLTQLTLGRLGRAQVEAMIERITSGKALPAEVVQQIVTKTDGVPLFVEELIKAILESSLLRAHEDHYELAGPLSSR
jgi:Adenylate and Guanylate cyclase catalytic domain